MDEKLPENTLKKQDTASTLKKSIAIIAMLIFAVGIFLYIGYYMFYDSDMLWTIATGDEILENGIPYKNPFTVVNDCDIIVQQWLFTILLALFDRAGGIGWMAFSILNVAFLLFCSFIYLHRSKVNLCWKIFFIACILAVVGYTSILRPRPETVTIGLLLLNCYALERYRDNGDMKILILLPLTMLLEANLHGAMILFHFTVYLAYLVPFPGLRHRWTISVKNESIETKRTFENEPIETKRTWTGKKIQTVLLFILASCVCMLINPYGINMVLYLPKSYLAGTFSLIPINEMQSDPGYMPFLIMGIVIAFAFIFWLFLIRKLKPEQIWFILGYSIIAAVAIRNVIFLYIAFIVLLPSVFRQISEKREENVFKMFSPTLCAVVIFTGILLGCISFGQWQKVFEYIYADWPERTAYMCTYDSDLYKIYDSLSAEEDENRSSNPIKIYTGFNNGGFMEYVGTHDDSLNLKIFMDPRPELAMKAINGREDYLKSYIYLCVKYDPEAYDYKNAWQTDVHDFIEDYGFDYLLVQQGHNDLIASYLLGTGLMLDDAEESSGTNILTFEWPSGIYDGNNELIVNSSLIYSEKMQQLSNGEEVISADKNWKLVSATDYSLLWKKIEDKGE